MGLLTAWALLLLLSMRMLHLMDNTNRATRSENLVAFQVGLLEMQGIFGPLKADPEGRLSLHMLTTTAAIHGHLDIVRHLCSDWGVPANTVPADEVRDFLPSHTIAGSEDMDTPLVQAIMNGHKDIALYLLSLPNQDLDLGRRMIPYNFTVLHLAVRQGMIVVFKKLVEQHGMDFAAPDGRGTTPLCLASISEYADMLAFIFELYHRHGRLAEVKLCSAAYEYRLTPTRVLHDIIRNAYLNEDTKIALSFVLIKYLGANEAVTLGNDNKYAYTLAEDQHHWRLITCMAYSYDKPECTFLLPSHIPLPAMTTKPETLYIRKQQSKKDEILQIKRERTEETKKVKGEMFNNVEEFLLHHAPSEFVCPITHDFLRTDPVVALDTFMYERSAIEGWFEICRKSGRPLTSPKMQEVLGDTLISNSTHKTLVNDYICQKKKEWRALMLGGGVGGADTHAA